jgi:hypothetical protein
LRNPFKTCRFLLLSACVSLFAACQNKGCYEQTDVKVVCTFYQTDLSRAVTLSGVSVWGMGMDSLLYNNKTVSKIELELNPNDSTTRYVFKMVTTNGTFYDTLTFYYNSETWFQSMDCDCMTFSTLDSCETAGSLFPSITLNQPKVTNSKTTHVVLNL